MDKRIFALGFFDGVHMGHQALLRECVRLAAKIGAEPAAITFEKHPKALFLNPPPVLLSTLDVRTKMLRGYGMDTVLVLPVKPEVMGQPWEQFLENLLAEGAVGFVCGDDFRFGDGGRGNAQSLMEFCRRRDLPCIMVEEQRCNGDRISSTKIRAFIESGDLESATAYLGHGYVVQVEENGRISAGIALPKPGRYACRVWENGNSHAAEVTVREDARVELPGISAPVLLELERLLPEQEG